MPISVTCTCGRQLQAKDEFAGRRTQCPDCGRELVIPGPSVEGPFFEPGPEKGPLGAQPSTSGMSIASLVLGLLSPFTCALTSLPGLVLGVLGLISANKSEGRIKGQGLAIAGITLSCLGLFVLAPLFVFALIPSTMKVRQAAQRVQCVNNLKQVGLAMHNFHDNFGGLPAQAITDAEGKPLLSWRVAILPYIEQDALYRQFHLDEPWDSPHNKALIPLMPRTYACPDDPPGEIAAGLTRYQAFVGPGAIMDPAVSKAQRGGPTIGVGLMTIMDGTSNTLLVCEAANPVEWTKPDDMPFTPKGPPPPVGSKHPGGENALMADGAVRFLKTDMDPITLEAMITRNGGEVVNLEP